jgi:putative tricarboxylic transport membrane protein
MSEPLTPSVNEPTAAHDPAPTRLQTLLGASVALLGVLMAVGASGIPADAGYAGVGPNFLPWVVSGGLMLCGVLLVVESLGPGGWKRYASPSGAASGDWRALAWVAAGILANAALITTVGFVLSCALCFVLAVRGLRQAEGRAAGDVRTTLGDVGVGLALSAPVYWLFTKLLAINLPGLTGSGWL